MKKLINRGAYKNPPQAIGSSKGFIVYQSMKNNPLFINCQDDVDELKKRRDLLEMAFASAKNGGAPQTNAKNKAYDFFIEQMDKVADKVESQADGDMGIATESGFDTLVEAKPVTDLMKPEGLKVVNADRSTEAKASFKPQRGVVNYQIQFQRPGETEWQTGVFTTNSRGTIISGLPIEGVTLFRICAFGRKGLQSEWSEPVSLRVI